MMTATLRPPKTLAKRLPIIYYTPIYAKRSVMERYRKLEGFTLIELSIVLVIIGLIVGGVLTGQDLIHAAAVRATLTQIEKYNQATNTFYGKYGGLPGDLPAAAAAQFGFVPRGNTVGQGDGNGIIQDGAGTGYGTSYGELAVFWVDLSTAKLIEGSFNTASEATPPPGIVPLAGISNYMPAARIGGGNFVYALSGGVNGGNGINYLTISNVTQLNGTITAPVIAVRDAYNIDRKIDDGSPQTGNVLAQYKASVAPNMTWVGAVDMSATQGNATTCYDNGNNAGATQQYSLTQNNGNGGNCALSFVMQGAGR